MPVYNVRTMYNLPSFHRTYSLHFQPVPLSTHYMPIYVVLYKVLQSVMISPGTIHTASYSVMDVSHHACYSCPGALSGKHTSLFSTCFTYVHCDGICYISANSELLVEIHNIGENVHSTYCCHIINWSR